MLNNCMLVVKINLVNVSMLYICLICVSEPDPNHPLWKTVSKLIDASLKPSTKKTYSSVQKQFMHFCKKNRVCALPASEATLLLFIGHCHEKGLKGTSIRCYLSAIRNLHINNGSWA